MDDMMEMLVGERIGQVLAQCNCRNRKNERMEKEILSKFQETDQEMANRLLEEFIEEAYQDCRLSYCAGVEDGIRIAREILTL